MTHIERLVASDASCAAGRRGVPGARAFTLIELMIVVAIIGILAGIAVPNYLKMTCRAKQSEGKGHVHKIAEIVALQYSETDGINPATGLAWSGTVVLDGCAGTVTGVSPYTLKGKSRYRYTIRYLSTSVPRWRVIADGCGEMLGDRLMAVETSTRGGVAVSHAPDVCPGMD